MRKPYAPTLNAQSVLAMLQDTRPVTEMAAESGIAPRLLHRWRRAVVERLPDLFADAAAAAPPAHAQEPHVEELYAPIGKLPTQLAWLQKMGARPGRLTPDGPWGIATTGRCRARCRRIGGA